MDFYKNVLNIELNDYTDLDAGSMSRGLAYERNAGRFEEVKEPQDGDVIAFCPRAPVPCRHIYPRENFAHVTTEKLPL